MQDQLEIWEKPRFVEISIFETGNSGSGAYWDMDSFDFDQS